MYKSVYYIVFDYYLIFIINCITVSNMVLEYLVVSHIQISNYHLTDNC